MVPGGGTDAEGYAAEIRNLFRSANIANHRIHSTIQALHNAGLFYVRKTLNITRVLNISRKIRRKKVWEDCPEYYSPLAEAVRSEGIPL